MRAVVPSSPMSGTPNSDHPTGDSARCPVESSFLDVQQPLRLTENSRQDPFRFQHQIGNGWNEACRNPCPEQQHEVQQSRYDGRTLRADQDSQISQGNKKEFHTGEIVIPVSFSPTDMAQDPPPMKETGPAIGGSGHSVQNDQGNQARVRSRSRISVRRVCSSASSSSLAGRPARTRRISLNRFIGTTSRK